MGNVGDDWDEQQNEQRGNEDRKVMLAPFRDMELGENPAWAKIDFHWVRFPPASSISVVAISVRNEGELLLLRDQLQFIGG